ncbi:hypothetical protein AAKU55_004263 [Oxalobacteraceae bacterium GrIS 1.11]
MRNRNVATHTLSLLTLACLAMACCQAQAASAEIQVYMDEINAPGVVGLDLHTNYVITGNRVPDYPGAQAPGRVLWLTPEFSYGLSPNWELGAYLLTSRDPHGSATLDGEKTRLKFIASKAADAAYFWGANLELGKVHYRLDGNPWNGELKGLFGYHGQRWTWAVNPNIGWNWAWKAITNWASSTNWGTSANKVRRGSRWSTPRCTASISTSGWAGV